MDTLTPRRTALPDFERVRRARRPLPAHLATPECKTCGGTGWQWSMRSWFKSDGYTRSRCGICSGTGKSAYRDNAAFCRWQAEVRALPRAKAASRAKGG